MYKYFKKFLILFSFIFMFTLNVNAENTVNITTPEPEKTTDEENIVNVTLKVGETKTIKYADILTENELSKYYYFYEDSKSIKPSEKKKYNLVAYSTIRASEIEITGVIKGTTTFLCKYTDNSDDYTLMSDKFKLGATKIVVTVTGSSPKQTKSGLAQLKGVATFKTSNATFKDCYLHYVDNLNDDSTGNDLYITIPSTKNSKLLKNKEIRLYDKNKKLLIALDVSKVPSSAYSYNINGLSRKGIDLQLSVGNKIISKKGVTYVWNSKTDTFKATTSKIKVSQVKYYKIVDKK